MDVVVWLKDRRKSSFFAMGAAIASVAVLGCNSAPLAEDASIGKSEPVSVGQRYLISTGSEYRGAKFTGRVTQANEDSIVMVDPQVEGWAENRWTLVEKIPGNHPFKGGKAVARQQRVGDVTINRADIVSIAAADEGGCSCEPVCL